MKRFYKDAGIAQDGTGFHVLLDGKKVRTPARNALTLPTAALAEAIAEEWRGQGDEVVPTAMPLLRLANTVQDGIGPAREDVVTAILRFGENDHLCYRGEGELKRRQAEAWDPPLAWAAEALDARLLVTEGIAHIAQPPEALSALRTAIAAYDDYALASLHVFASITGSAVLALAVAAGRVSMEEAFHISRLDEAWQAEKWGLDFEAEQRAKRLAHEMNVAAQFLALSRSAD